MLALPVSQDARGIWGRLSRTQRIGLGGIALTAVVVLALFATMARPDEYAPAFQNLREEDAAAIVAKLKDSKVPYEIADRGTTIKVPSAQVQETRLMIVQSGVAAKGSGVGFEIFAQPQFGLTEFAEKINYQRALEGELSRSIMRLDAVDAARVHLVLPEDSLFVSQKKEPSAAAVLQLKAGRKLDGAQVQGIVQLISGSVQGLKAEKVSVMDAAGAVLTDKGGEGDPSRQSNTRTEAQRQLESRLTDEVQRMLGPVVGPDKAVVRVSAELDWDQYESNAETFSPNQRAPQVRSRRESSESSSQGAATAGGVPGAERNVPGYPSPNGAGATQGGNEKRDVTTNYELSRQVEKTVRAPGGIKRLNVAVALDSEVVADPAQADAISRLVATAAGLNTDRGDLVTLTSLPFSVEGRAKPAELAEAARQRETMLSLARMVAMVLGPLLVVGLIWAVLRRGRRTSARPEITELNDAARLQSPLTAAEQLAALPDPVADSEQQRIEREVATMARNDPTMVANLIRSWLAEDKQRSAA